MISKCIRFFAHCLVIALTTIFITGCASISVQSDYSERTNNCIPYFEEFGTVTATYGGTILDGYIISAVISSAADGHLTDAGGAALILASIDLPLSFALDTALLPISIPRDIIFLAKCVF